VRYHFGGKDALYSAVLQEAYRDALQQYPPLLGVGDDAPAEERLHAFVHSFLLRILDEGRPAWFGKLMLREMAEPTGALGPLVDKSVKPLFELLSSIVRELMSEATNGRAMPKPLVRRCVASVVGQCTFYKNTRHVYSKLNPDQKYDRAALADLAAHVTRFSLAAIRDLAAGETQRNNSERGGSDRAQRKQSPRAR